MNKAGGHVLGNHNGHGKIDRQGAEDFFNSPCTSGRSTYQHYFIIRCIESMRVVIECSRPFLELMQIDIGYLTHLFQKLRCHLTQASRSIRGLQQEVECPFFQTLKYQGHLLARSPRKEQYRRGASAHHLLDSKYAVVVGHKQVQKQYIRTKLAGFFEGFFTILGSIKQYKISCLLCKNIAQHQAHQAGVVGKQYFYGHRHSRSNEVS